MSFSEEEVIYLGSQKLARIATVDPEGQPDVSPVTFDFDGTFLYVGGFDASRTRKFNNVRAGNAKVALVIDDLVSVEPWIARYLRIYGFAEIIERDGPSGTESSIRIRPTISWSRNLGGQSMTGNQQHTVRRTVHQSV